MKILANHSGRPVSGFHAHLTLDAAKSEGLPYLLVVTPPDVQRQTRYCGFATLGFSLKIAAAAKALEPKALVQLLHRRQSEGHFKFVAI